MSTMLRGKNLIIFLPWIDEKYTTRIFCMFLVRLKIFYQFKLTLDNNILHEFHPYFFSIKDHVTRRIMFRVHVMVASTANALIYWAFQASFHHNKVVVFYVASSLRRSIILCGATHF
jgi:hypothetical protein